MSTAAAPRIEGLDGLRALSITLVLLAHLSSTRGFGLPEPPLNLGILGVRVFFVISGFLITSLLEGEVLRTGGISLLRFYFRRTLRIFPPFYLYALVIALLAWAGATPLRPGDLTHALTYTMNYHRDRAWHLGHSWSLSVEEQFYLLWPALFRQLGRARAVVLLGAYLLVAPIWRLTLAFAWPEARLGIGETFFTTADSIATGCLLALSRNHLLAHPRYRRWVDSAWFYTVPLLVLSAAALSVSAKFEWLLGATLQNVFIAVAIERLTRDQGLGSRVLAWRPLVLLGLWSYSIYLWQQLFLNRHDQHSWWTAFPFNLVALLVVAVASYSLVEQPTLRLRERLEARWFGARHRIRAEAPVP